MRQPPETPRPGLPRAAVLLCAVLCLPVVFWLSYSAALDVLRQAQDATMRSRVRTLETVLSQQRVVVTVLADDGLAREALADPDTETLDRMSRKLDRIRTETGSTVIYLLDASGNAIAASNWDEGDSFVGSNYAFRDYFSQAMSQGQAAQYAIGTVSKRAGLYLSGSVVDGSGVAAGVIVVKIEFDRLEAAWQASSVRSFVSDPTGQVLLSSDPVLRLGPRPNLAWGTIVTSAPVAGTDWVLTSTGSGRPAVVSALMVSGSAAFVVSLVLIFVNRALRARHQAQRQAEADALYRADLERAVADRTQALQTEMQERQALAARLDRLSAEMAQANKLASLGQITAGVAHELNQPLATILLQAENGTAFLQAGDSNEVAQALDGIRRMTTRITRITDQLRGFARKAEGVVGPVSLRDTLEVALLLTAAHRGAQGIALSLPPLDNGVTVWADPLALEQILVNLLQNAQDALAGRPDPKIAITFDPGPPCRLCVIDNGPGLTADTHSNLFTPFLTTKSRGLGLGLVISRDLARSFGGEVWAAPPEPGQGARFVIDLPGAP